MTKLTDEQTLKLRQYYHSILGQQRVFEKMDGNVDRFPVQILDQECQALQNDFPGIVPVFDTQKFFSYRVKDTSYFDVGGINAYLAMALGRLMILIEEPPSSPVIEKREFAFVNEAELRRILERDYIEIQRAFVAQCWKSVIVLCGGAIETILVDLLITHKTSATNTSKSPNKPDIRKWDLADLINVAVELKLVGAGVEKLSHSIRDYRNLVHPGNELRSQLSINPEEAKIALEVLNIMIRDLSNK